MRTRLRWCIRAMMVTSAQNSASPPPTPCSCFTATARRSASSPRNTVPYAPRPTTSEKSLVAAFSSAYENRRGPPAGRYSSPSVRAISRYCEYLRRNAQNDSTPASSSTANSAVMMATFRIVVRACFGGTGSDSRTGHTVWIMLVIPVYGLLSLSDSATRRYVEISVFGDQYPSASCPPLYWRHVRSPPNLYPNARQPELCRQARSQSARFCGNSFDIRGPSSVAVVSAPPAKVTKSIRTNLSSLPRPLMFFLGAQAPSRVALRYPGGQTHWTLSAPTGTQILPAAQVPRMVQSSCTACHTTRHSRVLGTRLLPSPSSVSRRTRVLPWSEAIRLPPLISSVPSGVRFCRALAPLLMLAYMYIREALRLNPSVAAFTKLYLPLADCSVVPLPLAPLLGTACIAMSVSVGSAKLDQAAAAAAARRRGGIGDGRPDGPVCCAARGPGQAARRVNGERGGAVGLQGGVGLGLVGVPYDGFVGGVDPDGEAVAARSGVRRHEPGGEVPILGDEDAVAVAGAPDRVVGGEGGHLLLLLLLGGGERRDDEETEVEEEGEGGHGRARRSLWLGLAADVLPLPYLPGL
ncbi:hypothetical protein U9M48_008172 [Paspalum notatum var. saurae]|uniref:Uncharacterized protein n=1 Tax=Paspalum notatum var. saurae TaxID=547442 RepID=A0AAQ3SND8_PASNO